MRLDPDPRGDLHAGTIAASILNSVPRKGEAVQPWDLFPTIGRPPQRQSTRELLTAVEALTLTLGGKVVNADGRP